VAKPKEGGVWVVLTVLLLAGAGTFALSPWAPWNVERRGINPHQPPFPDLGQLPTPPPFPGSDVGRFAAFEGPDGSILILDTTTNELFVASESDARPYAERLKPPVPANLRGISVPAR